METIHANVAWVHHSHLWYFHLYAIWEVPDFAHRRYHSTLALLYWSFVFATLYKAFLISSLTSGLIICLIERALFSWIVILSLLAVFSIIWEIIVGYKYFHPLTSAEYALASCICVTVTHCPNELLKNAAMDTLVALGNDQLFSSANSIHVISQNPNFVK